ncbi:MAG: DegT/DnrJ/EryC1/StrS family aminotransferase [Methylotenera sp.]|nr:DegT/DnrJ/EryC1/StrS family aminotransferase [Methylotenera sp.]MDP1753955.1 DegT/DnrJ/EryC1/StrS family aminotransferase [Methylotenera sp.]MDP1959277.1 DegT/DnrJ/EryC1/StrS family aminotransferase [Methylotenera sp.]MDP3943917.1 DegT/DnrJ/EryC1/StrS family aminotransferase [Methylotenera sp.]
MIPVTKSFIPSLEDYQVYLEHIWREGQLTNNGPLVHKLASDLTAFLGVSNLELVTNGTLAIQLAIKVLGIQGEVITTPYSYVATTNSILWEGCKPVFVDIDDESFCIDPELIETAITPNTSAILATHVYGYPCDVVEIQRIADKYNLKVLYDAAHAFGVNLHGKSILTYGHCSTLSFHATKLFHTAEGGAVYCNDMEVSKGVSLLKKFGHMGEDNYIDIGINAKMSELHAAMGLCVLPKVNDIIAQRRLCSSWYDELLTGCDLQRPQLVDGLEYNYAYYPVVFSTHEIMMNVRQVLFDNGIGPRRYFYPSLNTLPFLSNESKVSCPVSESIATRVLCMPLYVELSKEDVTFICGLVRQCLQR